MGCHWVHPEVALLIGTLKVPSDEGDTTRFTSTMVFILTEEGWELEWSHGVLQPD
jgi:hypothetical protein